MEEDEEVRGVEGVFPVEVYDFGGGIPKPWYRPGAAPEVDADVEAEGRRGAGEGIARSSQDFAFELVGVPPRRAELPPSLALAPS